MFQSLSPLRAGQLAKAIRAATGGMNSSYPHLMITGDPAQLVALLKRHRTQDTHKNRI